MCFFSKPQPVARAIPVPVERDANAGLSQLARLEASKRRGVFANIFTTALGDSSFGQSIRRATVLGGGQRVVSPENA